MTKERTRWEHRKDGSQSDRHAGQVLFGRRVLGAIVNLLPESEVVVHSTRRRTERAEIKGRGPRRVSTC